MMIVRRGRRILCPCVQVGLGNRPCADVRPAGLEDRHGHRADIVKVIEEVQRAQRIQHHLGILFGFHLNALPVLEIDHVQSTVGDDQAVAGAESVFCESGVVEPLLYQHVGIGAVLVSFRKRLHYECGVLGRTFLHLIGVVAERLPDICYLGHVLAEGAAQPVLAKRVRVGALGGVIAALVFVALRKARRRWAVQPAVRGGRAEQRVFTHCPAPLHADGSSTLVNLDFLNDAVNITNGAYDEKTSYDKTQEWLALRAADINFVLDEFLHNESRKIPEDVFARIDPDKIGLSGHSLGGATAAKLGRERPDVDAVAVLDGTMFGEEVAFENGSVVLTGNPYPVPLLNLYNEDHYEEARQLGTAYDNLSASAHAVEAYDVLIHGSGHLNFTDLPLFFPALAHMLGTGTVDSRYCIETMNQIVLEFFNHTLKDGTYLHLQSAY